MQDNFPPLICTHQAGLADREEGGVLDREHSHIFSSQLDSRASSCAPAFASSSKFVIFRDSRTVSVVETVRYCSGSSSLEVIVTLAFTENLPGEEEKKTTTQLLSGTSQC